MMEATSASTVQRQATIVSTPQSQATTPQYETAKYDISKLDRISPDTTCVACHGKDGGGRTVTIGFRYKDCGDIIDFDCLNNGNRTNYGACPNHPNSKEVENISFKTDHPLNRFRIKFYDIINRCHVAQDFPVNPICEPEDLTYTTNYMTREVGCKSGLTEGYNKGNLYSTGKIRGYIGYLPGPLIHRFNNYTQTTIDKPHVGWKQFSNEIDPETRKVIQVISATPCDVSNSNKEFKLGDDLLDDPNAFTYPEWNVEPKPPVKLHDMTCKCGCNIL